MGKMKSRETTASGCWQRGPTHKGWPWVIADVTAMIWAARSGRLRTVRSRVRICGSEHRYCPAKIYAGGRTDTVSAKRSCVSHLGLAQIA